MNIPEIAKCPNPECKSACSWESVMTPLTIRFRLKCDKDCGYHAPWSQARSYGRDDEFYSRDEAIRLHNAICRQPTPEAADNEPDFDLWTRIAFYAIKAAEKQNGVRLIPMGDEDAEAFMESIDCALQESLEEILEPDSDEAAHPPKPEPTEAHSKSEYKRLSAQGVNVVPPKPTEEWMAELAGIKEQLRKLHAVVCRLHDLQHYSAGDKHENA